MLDKKQTSVIYRLSVFLKNIKFYFRPILELGTIILKSIEHLAFKLGCIEQKIIKLD